MSKQMGYYHQDNNNMDELIQKMNGVFLSVEEYDKNKWVAKSCESINKEDNRVLLIHGETPKEAVENLYKELLKYKKI